MLSSDDERTLRELEHRVRFEDPRFARTMRIDHERVRHTTRVLVAIAAALLAVGTSVCVLALANALPVVAVAGGGVAGLGAGVAGAALARAVMLRPGGALALRLRRVAR